MNNYVHKAQIATICTDATFSTAINLTGFNHAFIGVEIPTFAIGISTDSCGVYFQVANTSTTSEFRPLMAEVVVSNATGGFNTVWIPNSIGNYNCVVGPITAKYVRLELKHKDGNSRTATAGLNCLVHCFA